MKNLKEYILESVSNKLITLINSINYDFSETSSMSNSTKENRAKKAKAQEKILIDAINGAQEEYNAIGCEEYCNLINKKYSFEEDSKIGDIIIMKNDKPEMFIDLKVANSNNYLGTPDMLSLVNFATVATENDDKKYYLCCNLNGSNSKLIKASKVYNKVLSKEANIIVSKDRSNISPEVKKLTNKVKLVAPKNMDNADLTKLYDEDFVATSVIENI